MLQVVAIYVAWFARQTQVSSNAGVTGLDVACNIPRTLWSRGKQICRQGREKEAPERAPDERDEGHHERWGLMDG